MQGFSRIYLNDRAAGGRGRRPLPPLRRAAELIGQPPRAIAGRDARRIRLFTS